MLLQLKVVIILTMLKPKNIYFLFVEVDCNAIYFKHQVI